MGEKDTKVKIRESRINNQDLVNDKIENRLLRHIISYYCYITLVGFSFFYLDSWFLILGS